MNAMGHDVPSVEREEHERADRVCSGGSAVGGERLPAVGECGCADSCSSFRGALFREFPRWLARLDQGPDHLLADPLPPEFHERVRVQHELRTDSDPTDDVLIGISRLGETDDVVKRDPEHSSRHEHEEGSGQKHRAAAVARPARRPGRASGDAPSAETGLHRGRQPDCYESAYFGVDTPQREVWPLARTAGAAVLKHRAPPFARSAPLKHGTPPLDVWQVCGRAVRVGRLSGLGS